jgi:SH3 domain protein
MRRLSIALLAALCSLAAQAAHITDKLVVGLYKDATLKGEPAQLLTSGTPVEILERAKDVVQVRLADDARGWVEAGYVTDEKPARMMLLEAQAEIRQLKSQLEGQGSDGAAAAAATADLPSVRQVKLQEQLDQANAQIAELRQAGEQLQQAKRQIAQLQLDKERLDQARKLLGVAAPDESAGHATSGSFTRFLPWIAGALALVIGFGAGIAFIDYRIRKRYGGFRI